MTPTLGTMAEEKAILPVVHYCYNSNLIFYAFYYNAPFLSSSLKPFAFGNLNYERNIKQCVKVISYKMGTCVPGFPSAPSVPSGPLRPCRQRTHTNCTTENIRNYTDPF